MKEWGIDYRVSIMEEWVINNQKDCQNFMFSVISYRLFTVAH